MTTDAQLATLRKERTELNRRIERNNFTVKGELAAAQTRLFNLNVLIYSAIQETRK